MTERRYCARCLDYTVHNILDEDKAGRNPRGRAVYKCTRCGRVTSRRLYRPSSEIGY